MATARRPRAPRGAPLTTEERLWQSGIDAHAGSSGDFQAALEAFRAELQQDAELLQALLGEAVIARRATDFLRLVKASAHGRALGATNKDTTPEAKTDAARRRLLGLEITGMMGTYLIAGKPLGICTKGELLAAAIADRRHAAFKESIATLLPDPQSVVLHYVTAHTVETLWKRSTP